jgi:hypothetical protein
VKSAQVALGVAAQLVVGIATMTVTPVMAAAAAPTAQVRAASTPIDRRALVTRHNVILTRIDPHAPVMLGNGNLGFTADITGLQSFPQAYSSVAPLLTMAQWGWHSFPNPQNFTEASGFTMVPVPGRGERPYSYFTDFSAVTPGSALQWLRENPHRFSLARIAMALRSAEGRDVEVTQLRDTRQELDLWTGTLHSHFVVDGAPVEVETRVHPGRDMLLVDIRSALINSGRLSVRVSYPGVAQNLNPDPSDWVREERHQTRVLKQGERSLEVERRLDGTLLHSTITVREGRIYPEGKHRFQVRGAKGRMTLAVSFDRKSTPAPVIDALADARAVSNFWRDYWMHGGMIDFSGSTDPRAAELERRVVLSQYLAAINQAGELPPQEEGLFSNSWNGKFHLEMHLWHAAHFATWGRPERLTRSLEWYLQQLPTAQAVAQRMGVRGAWWTKMSGPEGRNSPSTINPFIMWQQPHPIYLAELLWRHTRDRKTLDRYAELVDQTAWLLATYPRLNEFTGHHELGPPVIPVQENHPPLTTMNPAFEVEYFAFGLRLATQWRQRRGLQPVPEWERMLASLAAPRGRGRELVLPVESEPDFWKQTMSPACSKHAQGSCPNRDHPSFLMIFGLLPNERVDHEAMRDTLRATEMHWDLKQTWGWDFPMMAMTAARLGDVGKAVDLLFADYPNNAWGVTGMTPRFSIENGEPRRVAETYFPSNGALLLAVGMMAAGWGTSAGAAPGFPDGWNVKAEGIDPLP